MIAYRFSLLRASCFFLVAVVSAATMGQVPPVADIDVAIGNAIDRLSGRRFEVRQQASDRLVSEGSYAIAAVESRATAGGFEHAHRCVEILARLAVADESREAALSALDRLADNESFLEFALAKRAAFELRETKAERAVRLLAAAGIRVHRLPSDNRVRSVSGIYRDRQCAYLRYLPSLSSVSLSGPAVTDQCFQHLVSLPQLTSVTIMRCSISNAGLAQLPKLRRLQRVSISGESFSAAGLKHLGEISDLNSVAIFSPIGIDELQVLGDLPLRSLYLSDLEMSDGVADILARLDGVSSLHVTIKGVRNEDLDWVRQTKARSIGLTIEDSPQMTDEGLVRLNVPRLQTLSLNNTGITQQGLAKVAEFDSLLTLSLWHTPITDEGLKQLIKLTRLRSLSLGNTKVSEQGVETLKKLMPNLRYVHRYDVPAAKPAAVAPPPPAAKPAAQS